MHFDTTQPAYVTFRNRVTEGTTNVVAWVGAGLSVEAGLPTWTMLRKALTDTLKANATSFGVADGDRALAKALLVESQTDPWLAFQMLEDSLGPATFRDVIRQQLAVPAHSRTPRTYKHLWNLPTIGGVLNLNLDRLATRAYGEKNASSTPHEFSGFEIENAAHVLKSPQPFILNLHGRSEDSSSWVLTRKQLNALASKPAYQEFISACLLTKTVLFVGISVDDIAVGGYLEKLSQKFNDFGSHFWITNRRDEATDRWAEQRGVRVIRYESKGGDHSGLDEFFQDLQRYVPTDDTPPPVVRDKSEVPAQSLEINPDELARKDAEIIREVLNAKAKEILSSANADRLDSFMKFCEKYDEAIYRAWYTSASGDRSTLFGYRLQEYVARGAFGTVYSAIDKAGKHVAVKVLNQELRGNGQMLESFRRGVRSMRILSDRGVPGMVPYLDASEIPAVVVMDWVDGPNLEAATKAGYMNDWSTRLKVMTALAGIVRSAHGLPERVLHRDVRPPNVMLKGYFEDAEAFEVVVLDFDLSWHMGATEKSIVLNSATGYLAPEQLQTIAGVSTRHASVDAFGLGMCLYYITSGRDPFPAEHAHANWQQTVFAACAKKICTSWKSLPQRFARIILNATKHRQSERWDMAQIEGELQRLSIAHEYPSSVVSAEMFAEEMFARSTYAKEYEWIEGALCARIILPSGLEISVTGDEAKSELLMKIRWSSGGDYNRRRVTKWLPEAGRKVSDLLTGHKWRVEGSSAWGEQVDLSASIAIPNLSNRLDANAELLEKISSHLRFQ
jgi:serine/threonine protein kinase